MAWFHSYERDVLGLPGAGRYSRTAPVSSTSQQPDSGISRPSTHMTPVRPADPGSARVRSLVRDLLHGFVTGMFSHAFGNIGGHAPPARQRRRNPTKGARS